MSSSLMRCAVLLLLGVASVCVMADYVTQPIPVRLMEATLDARDLGAGPFVDSHVASAYYGSASQRRLLQAQPARRTVATTPTTQPTTSAGGPAAAGGPGGGPGGGHDDDKDKDGKDGKDGEKGAKGDKGDKGKDDKCNEWQCLKKSLRIGQIIECNTASDEIVVPSGTKVDRYYQNEDHANGGSDFGSFPADAQTILLPPAAANPGVQVIVASVSVEDNRFGTPCEEEADGDESVPTWPLIVVLPQASGDVVVCDGIPSDSADYDETPCGFGISPYHGAIAFTSDGINAWTADF